jgi:hypothetical protein
MRVSKRASRDPGNLDINLVRSIDAICRRFETDPARG